MMVCKLGALGPIGINNYQYKKGLQMQDQHMQRKWVFMHLERQGQHSTMNNEACPPSIISGMTLWPCPWYALGGSHSPNWCSTGGGNQPARNPYESSHININMDVNMNINIHIHIHIHILYLHINIHININIMRGYARKECTNGQILVMPPARLSGLTLSGFHLT